MRHLLPILLCVVLARTNLPAQPDIVSKFLFRSHTFNGTTLAYRLFIPDSYSVAQRYPVVLALHGSGDIGTDNTSQLTSSRLATSWADPVHQAGYPCFVVAPQCPPDGNWATYLPPSSPMSPQLATANDILDSLAREFSIDTNRYYVTGLSMGGDGTWEMVMHLPNRYAAAVPMSGGIDPSMVSYFADVPIWNFHGAIDLIVPVYWSRNMISALHALGKTVVYTMCHNLDCSGLPDSAIDMEIRSHADLLYTEYPNLGHVVLLWNDSYDDPFLRPWVFSKYKRWPGSITLTNLKSRQTISGSSAIHWNTSAPGDSVEIWFSPDAGFSWKAITTGAPNTGTFLWNTTLVPDCALGSVRVFLKNSLGFVIGSDSSSFFAINNPGNGAPFVRILNDEFTTGAVFDQDSLDLNLLVGDPEGTPLSASVLYSFDGGSSFSMFDSYTAPADTVGQTRRIGIGPLPNSSQAVIAFSASDGSLNSTVSTFPFAKITPRTVPGPSMAHVAGTGGAKPAAHIIVPPALTGHRYRLTFDDTSSAQKQYSVLDVDRGMNVVQHATELYGVAEGPLFDGIRLVIGDAPQAFVDTAGTRWTTRPGIMHVYVSVPNRTIGPNTWRGFPDPYDYQLTVYNTIVDTSKDGFGLTATPMKFTVWNLTKNRKADVGYYDANGNNTIGPLDEVDILEPDSVGNPRLSWSMTFYVAQGDVQPVPGDQFRITTVKPVTSSDVYEFVGEISSVPRDALPLGYSLQQNYPNPFNPTTTIEYTIGGVVRPTNVRLVVYDILGREVATLVNGTMQPGRHSVRFDGSRLATGVYFYQIHAGSLVQTRKLLLVR